MFKGFLVPTDGVIKEFMVLDTGFKINNQDMSLYITLNLPIPLFTLVLIRQNQEPVDIGTYYFKYESTPVRGHRGTNININKSYEFKYTTPENTGFNVKKKDIINIRNDFNTNKLSDNRFVMRTHPNYKIDDIETDFFTYLTTILIELDPL